MMFLTRICLLSGMVALVCADLWGSETAASGTPGPNEPSLVAGWREWIDREGRVVVARFQAANEGAGLMELRFGDVYLVELELLSPEDQKYVQRLVEEGLIPRLWTEEEIVRDLALELSQPYRFKLPRSINQYIRDLPEVVEAQRRTDLAPREKYFDERDRLRRTIIEAEDEYDKFFREFLKPVGAFIGINNSLGPTQVDLPYIHGLEFLGRFNQPANRRRCLRFLKQQVEYVSYVKEVIADAVRKTRHMVDRADSNAFRSRLERGAVALESVFSDDTGLSYDELKEVAWILDEVRAMIDQIEAEGAGF